MINENLLIYYFSSGIFMSILCFIFYERISKEVEAVEWVGRTVFVGINFFFGFLNTPIAIVMLFISAIKRIHLFFLLMENKRLKIKLEKLKELEKQLKNNNHESNN